MSNTAAASDAAAAEPSQSAVGVGAISPDDVELSDDALMASDDNDNDQDNNDSDAEGLQQRRAKHNAHGASSAAAEGLHVDTVAASPASSHSTGAASAASGSNGHGHGGGSHTGFTAEGVKFHVPDTLNTAETFLPHNLSLGSAISAAVFLTATWWTLFGDVGVWLNICIFFFWRLSYDLGLGLILRAQSEHKWFLKHYLAFYAQGGWRANLCDHLARRQLSSAVRHNPPIESYPQEFRAWLVYKNLVNIVLVNDGLTYILLWYKCFRLPSSLDALVLLQYAVGVFLGVFNYWAKVDAHRCIGEYSWFWGDFFFRRELHLTFDGIFELFPHPMYTVGYALYYGASLLARSYTLLFCSLIAHGCQLAFLFFVEEPHIARTYGSSMPRLDKSKLAVLYDPKSGWFPDKNDSVFLLSIDLFRSGDFAVVLCCLYALAVALLPTNPSWALAQVALWRVIHWVGLGAVLWTQSRYQSWTRHFTSKGRTLYEAFAQWKNTYNLSLTLNTVTFVLAAVRYFVADFEWGQLLRPSFMACLLVGGVLVGLSIWSFMSTWEAVGEFGWFYGDFFVPEQAFRTDLCYTGIYRFLNNPDAVTGYAGQYGLALMAQSWEIFALAIASHGLNILFLHLVEAPHMARLYSSKEVRLESPFPRALKKMQRKVKEKGEEVKEKSEQALRRLRKAARDATSPSSSPRAGPMNQQHGSSASASASNSDANE